MNPIILEGPDGSGKTTLAQKLQKQFYEVRHLSVPKNNDTVFSLYISQLFKYRLHKTVYDRLHLGEPIYGQLVRHKPQFDMRGADVIESFITALGGQTVICLPPYDVCFHNWLENHTHEYIKDVKVFKRVYAAYARLLMSGRPYIWYDYTRHRTREFAAALSYMKSNVHNQFSGMPVRMIIKSLQEKIR